MGLYLKDKKVSPALIEKVSSGVSEVKEYIGGQNESSAVDLRTLLLNDNPEAFTITKWFKYRESSSFSSISADIITKFVKMTSYTNSGYNYIEYQSPDYRDYNTVYQSISYSNSKDVQHNIVLIFNISTNDITFNYNSLAYGANQDDILIYKDEKYIPQKIETSYSYQQGPFNKDMFVNIKFSWGNGSTIETIHFIADTNNQRWQDVYKTLYDVNNNNNKTLLFQCTSFTGSSSYSFSDFSVSDLDSNTYSIDEVSNIYGV